MEKALTRRIVKRTDVEADTHMPMPLPVPETERAPVGPPVVGFGDTIQADAYPERPPREITPRICPICGAGLRGRQTSACSDKCRAAKSRRKRVPIPAQDLRGIRDGLVALLDTLWEVKATLEKYLRG